MPNTEEKMQRVGAGSVQTLRRLRVALCRSNVCPLSLQLNDALFARAKKIGQIIADAEAEKE